MAEFISQSEPVTPPSITEVTKPKSKRDPNLYMNNERNMYQTVFTGCVVLLMSLYIPSVLPSDSSKWMAVGLAITSIITLFLSLYLYKRNIEAFEANEQEYIDWKQSSIMIYCIVSALLIVSSMVLYELYWNAADNRKGNPVNDTLDEIRSIGSERSFKSSSSKGSR